MSTGIFLIERDGKLVELMERPYESEDFLQGLLASHPALLSGKEIDPDEPRRWVLVTREASVPAEEGGAGRWSVDHLFLDQAGIPTLVEVKRSSDTRIRREVVGQMLDYAANGVVYWPVETIRSHFERRCAAEGLEPSALLEDLLGVGEDLESYWARVKENLEAGRVRMLFVADAIPAELRRIVEFLNEQMKSAEVLAVEVRQFVSGELRTLVPRVYGRTEQAQATKSTGTRQTRQWDAETLLKALGERSGAAAVKAAKALLAWAHQAPVDLWWGHGAQDGSFTLYVKDPKNPQWLVSCWTYGRIEVLFQYMKTNVPFSSVELREELRRRLNEVPGIDIPDSSLDRRPRIDAKDLASEETVAKFTSVLDWVLEQRRIWERAQE